jgi:hypothetical protein
MTFFSRSYYAILHVMYGDTLHKKIKNKKFITKKKEGYRKAFFIIIVIYDLSFGCVFCIAVY